MSFIDASQLASAGASQVVAFHQAPTQTINNGIISLMSRANAERPASMPPRQTPALRAPSLSLAKGRNRYDLLRALAQSGPRTAIGIEAQSLILRQTLLARTGLSQRALRPQVRAVDQLLQKAAKTGDVAPTVDPQKSLKLAMSPHRALQSPSAYRILKNGLNALPSPSSKTISLKQLPEVRKGMLLRTLKNAGLAILPPDVARIVKPALTAIAGATPPKPMGRKKSLAGLNFG